MDGSVAAFDFDVDRLLSPISVGEPTGESLRYEGTYDHIAGLRREDDSSLEQGAWVNEAKRADWQNVAQACVLAIETRSKDVQIAAWLLEAWIHQHGFAGLREGLRVLAGLCDTYWDGLHPQIEGEDLEYRLAAFAWIDEKLSIQISLVTVTCPQSDNVGAFSAADWETASRRQGRPHSGNPDEVTLERFEQSLTLTPTAWLSSVAAAARSAAEVLDELVGVLDRRCGRSAPSFGRIRHAIASAIGLLSVGLQGREEARAGSTAVQEISGSADSHTEKIAPADRSDEQIRTRGEAYRQLAEAADFLMRTEPHSPVPHLVRRAIAWGSLSLEDLLPELVSESTQLSEIYRLLQLRGREPPK